MSGASDHRVRKLLIRAIRAGRFPGAAALWGRPGGRTSTCVAGCALLPPAPRDIAVDTWFDLASLTKPLVTTTLSLMAFREGALTPTTTVGEVLRETVHSPVGDLEVRHLLTHASGLPAWLPFYCLAEGRRSRLANELQRIPVATPQGSRVVYSCVGFVLLGLILEQVCGANLEESFRRQVLAPAGLVDDLGFNPDPALRPIAGGAGEPLAEQSLVRDLGLDPKWIPPVATGRPDDGNARFFGGAAGNAGLFGTLRGVQRLTAEYFGAETTLLTPEEVRPAVESQTPGLEQQRGYGWQIATSPDCSAGTGLSVNAFGHTGFTGVSVWAEPAAGGIWVLLTNRNHPGQRGVDLHPVRRRFHDLASVL